MMQHKRPTELPIGRRMGRGLPKKKARQCRPIRYAMFRPAVRGFSHYAASDKTELTELTP